MKSCVIITSYFEGDLKELLSDINFDYVICADGGYKHAAAAGIQPNLVVGDFDSYTLGIPAGIEVCSLPTEKNDTDTIFCVRCAIERGAERIAIIGGLGGRLDHTLSNIQTLAFAAENAPEISVSIRDMQNIVSLLSAGAASEDDAEDAAPKKCTIKKREGYKLSLLSLSESCRGVSVSGVHYPLENAELRYDFPLGISNEFEEEIAEISLVSGKLLLVLSKDLL